MKRLGRIGCLSVLCSAAVASPCNATGPSDGSYGRIDGDVTCSAALGAAVASHSYGVHASAAARYLDTAGLYVSLYAPLAPIERAKERAVSAGLSLRPLFLPRFLTNRETGPAWADLVIDSFTLHVGAVAIWQTHFEWIRPGLELGAQIGLPLRSAARGPWLLAGTAMQWSPTDLAHSSHAATSTLAFAAIAWQGIFDAGIVDLHDTRPR